MFNKFNLNLNLLSNIFARVFVRKIYSSKSFLKNINDQEEKQISLV